MSDSIETLNAKISGLNALIGEKDKIIAWMEERIKALDEAYANSERLIQERDKAILNIEKVLEERWKIIQNYETDINNRNLEIERMRGELDSIRNSSPFR